LDQMKYSDQKTERHPIIAFGTAGYPAPVSTSRFGPDPRSEILTGVLATIGAIAEAELERIGDFHDPIRGNQREFLIAIDLVESANDSWAVEQEVNAELDRLRVRRADERRRDQLRRDSANNFWSSCVAPHGSPTERYLITRGCTLPDTAYLRHHDCLFHPASKRHLPAMVAGVTVYPSKRVCGVHRTFLQADGSGKANVSPSKMMLGPIKYGAVRLAPPGPCMGIAEGIETALACQQATGIPTWAALSSGNLVHMALPPISVTPEVVIFADRDNSGRAAAEAAADRFIREGRRVRIAEPIAGCNDFNDLLLRDGGDAA
jgi:hypothetical protein